MSDNRLPALVWATLCGMLIASIAFLGWAVSVEKDRAHAGLEARVTADAPAAALVPRAKGGEHEEAGAFVLGKDGAAARGWPFAADVLDALDDAVGGCLPRPAQREGSVVRVVAERERGEAGPLRILAVEYRPPGGSPERFYAPRAGAAGAASGAFTDNGARSCGAGWQAPLDSLRRTSRFNPQRMHPILHRLMPHEGTDFGAPKGTPVYASHRGVVDWVGPHGSHGNWVSLIHPDGVETGYAHLSRFAPGLKHGDAVQGGQIVGYVGSTGRSTGPHLHFSARRDGAYFDAETLLPSAAARPGPGVPEAEQAAFLAARAELDRRLDAVPLPPPPSPLSPGAAPGAAPPARPAKAAPPPAAGGG